MIVSGGYTLSYNILQNQIIITLPQTYQTLSDSFTVVSNRRNELSDSEQTFLLMIVRQLFEKKEE